jgi:V/A-type H+-transporting ATPase subunit K
MNVRFERLAGRPGLMILAFGITLAAGISLVATWMLLSAPAALAADAAAAAVAPDIVRWGFASAAVSASLSAVAAGYAVAQVGSAAVGALTEKPELMGRVLVVVGLAEGIAIYGLIIAILILNRLG